MKISVIIPTYKRSHLVTLTLDSLLQQNFSLKDFEIIVVDNNSPDDTEMVIRNYINSHQGVANIRYTKEMRQGDVYARNTGAFLAEGEYLYFTDDDALFDGNLLSCLVNILDCYPQVAMVGSRIVIKWDIAPASWVKRYEYLLGACSYGRSGYIIKSHDLCIANGSLAIRKSVFYEVGGNNPGQIGEYLVGNAEVGLFRKIHKLGYPTAFTDDTTMWHMQAKDKNGTYRDIIRRIENNAISDAYTHVVEMNRIDYKNLNHARRNVISSILCLSRASIRNSYFEYRAAKKYNEWVDKYCDKDFLNSIEREDYILGTDYRCPDIMYRSDVAK